MKNLIKKTTLFASLVLSVFILAGCSGDKKHHGNHHKHDMHSKTMMCEDNMNVEKMYAKIYTKSTKGGHSEIGHVKLWNEKNGVKAELELKDLRQGVKYEPMFAEYNCKNKDMKNCTMNDLNVKMPDLMARDNGELETTFWIPNIGLTDLCGTKFIMQRDNGYKAAWGLVKAYKM